MLLSTCFFYYNTYQLADKTVINFILSLQFLAEARIAEIQRIRNELYTDKDHMEKIKMDELIDRMKSGGVTLIDVRPKGVGALWSGTKRETTGNRFPSYRCALTIICGILD